MTDTMNNNEFDKLIFEQELNEVYLLLEFISGRPDKHLSDIGGRIFDNDGKALSSKEIIERVSGLRYPPAQQAFKKNEDAAFLLNLKDALNLLSYPARGSTIAYTILFSEGRPQSDTIRVRAAQTAFPGLISSASSFKHVKDMLAWSGLFITIISATFLWQVTYGVQLASHFDEAKRNETEITSRVYDQIDKERATTKDIGQYDLNNICQVTGDKSEHNAIDMRSSDMHKLCNDYAYKHALLCVSVNDVGSYSQSWMFYFAQMLLPIHDLQRSIDCTTGQPSNGKGRQEDAPSVVGVLAMMSNYILPILFGLVGTLAALVRGIQDKVTESMLSPRDRSLSLIRLPLGMVAGVCVGLFLSPAGVATQTGGNVGAFTISASGIAFLAGYGAEGFFLALDALIARIFSLDAFHRDTRSANRP